MDLKLAELKRKHLSDPGHKPSEVCYLRALQAVGDESFEKREGVSIDDRIEFLLGKVEKPAEEFICFYPGSWGTGKTLEKAKSNARKSGGRGYCWVILKLPEWGFDAWVDGLGRSHWTWAKGYIDPCPFKMEARCRVVKFGKKWTGRKK